jgi:hypothetical protein
MLQLQLRASIDSESVATVVSEIVLLRNTVKRETDCKWLSLQHASYLPKSEPADNTAEHMHDGMWSWH